MKYFLLSLAIVFSFAISYGQSANQKETLLLQITQQKKKLRRKPDDTKALSTIAMGYYMLSDMQTAITYYDRLIALKPTLSGAYANRGVCRLLTGDKQGACADFSLSVANGEDPKIIDNKRLSEYVAGECGK